MNTSLSVCPAATGAVGSTTQTEQLTLRRRWPGGRWRGVHLIERTPAHALQVCPTVEPRFPCAPACSWSRPSVPWSAPRPAPPLRRAPDRLPSPRRRNPTSLPSTRICPPSARWPACSVGRSSGSVDPAARERQRPRHVDEPRRGPARSPRRSPIDRVTAVAAPRSGPTSRTLLPIPANPLLTAGVINGTVTADYGTGSTCPARSTACGPTRMRPPPWPPPWSGTSRRCPESRRECRATSPRSPPHTREPPPSSSTTTPAAPTSSPSTTTSVGDVSLFGGQAVVKVTSPVVLRAHSDGTTGQRSPTTRRPRSGC